ncbi:MAG: response regulator [Chloroflexota bacterium]|nr:response regulator [Chloroflexota bacterium]
MSDKHILIVEDEPDGADLVLRMLRATGQPTAVADNAESAFEMLMAAPDSYKGVLIDLALPQMDGFELMTLIRNTQGVQHLPLIAMTAFHTPELRVRALENGFDAYFPKPLDTTIFASSLARVLKD